MKKTVLMIMALLAAVPMVGQPALTKGMESKRLESGDLLDGLYVGTLSNLDAWVFEGKKGVKQLTLTDVNLETVTVVPLPRSGSMDVLAAGVSGGQAGVLLVDGSASKRTVVYGCTVDPEEERLVGDGYDTLLTLTYDKKDKCMVWGAASPSGAYVALAAVVQMNDKKQYSAYTALFDGSLRKLWEREFPLETMHSMCVTDEGRVVTLGMEPDGEETRFVFNILETGRADSYGVTVRCDPVTDLRLAGVVGSHAMAMGIYRPAEGRKADRLTYGVMGLSFDIDSALLRGVTMRPFQNEDMNIFLNKKTKKMQREQVIEHVKVFGTAPTPFGAVLVAGRDIQTETTSQSGVTKREGYAIGLHMVAVDTTGRVRWVRNFRRNDVDKEEGRLDRIALTTADGKVCLVRSEHPKSPAIYDIANDAKQFEVGSKCNVVLYTVDSEGMTQKLLLEAKSKQNVLRALTRQDGTLLYLSARGGKTRLAELRFRY